MLAFFLTALESEEDRRRFASLYEQYHEKMEAIAIHILKEQKDAEDAVQNAYIQIIRHFEKISEIPCDKLPFWIISIVKNEALGILRKKQRTISLEDWEAPAVETDPTGYKELVALFARLPDTYRAVLEMKFLMGYTGREIAGKLGISESAVNTRVSRGREALQKIVKKEGFYL